jgi:hypothetical protein
MRRAAVLAGLVPDGDWQARVQFVTEGEAILHFCIGNCPMTDAVMVHSSPTECNPTRELIAFYQHEEGIIIVNAGDEIVDLSAYCRTTSLNSFEEIAPPECRSSFTH